MTIEAPPGTGKRAKGTDKRKWTRAVLIIAAAVATACALYIVTRIFVASPYAAEWLSGYLSRTLRQRVTIAGLALSGSTLSARGIVVSNPQGFPGDPFLSVASLLVAPDVTGIAVGKKSLSLVQVDGLKVDLRKNAAGEWNYQQIVQSLKQRKKGPSAGISIGSLVFRNVSLKAGDLALHKLAFTVHDFSTKGSEHSKLIFTGADEKGNPFRLSAGGRLGTDADVDLSLDAPHFSLESFKNIAKGRPFLDLGKGMAGVFLSVKYRSGDAVAKGHMSCDNVGIAVRGGKVPLRGRFDFAARYNAVRDEAELETASLVINEKIGIRASGVVRQVKSTRDFKMGVACDEIHLRDLSASVPKAVTGDLVLNGSLTCRDLYLAGNRVQGISAGGGKVLLRNGGVAKGDRPLIGGISSDARISRIREGWRIAGSLFANMPSGSVPLEDIQSRFIADFSDRFKPLSIEVPVLTAAIRGVPVRGELTYEPKRRDPYKGTLLATAVPLPALNDLLSGKNIRFSSGTADITMEGVAQGPATFSCAITNRFSRVNGAVSGKSLSLDNGEISARLARSGGGMTADGRLKVEDGAYSGKKLSVSSAFTLAGGAFSLKGGRADLDRLTILFADIHGRLPLRQVGSAGSRYPLELSLKGLDVIARDMRLQDVSGSMTGSLATGAAEKKLVGKADLKLPSVHFRGRPVASLTAHAELNGKDTVVNLSGAALDGALTSIVRLDPFAPGRGTSFVAAVKNARAGKLSEMAPPRSPVSVPAGLLSASLVGKWSTDAGVHCEIEGSGTGVTLAASAGKALVSEASLALKALVAGTSVSVRGASITRTDGVSLMISGDIADAVSPTRKGKFALELGSVAVPSLVSTLANILPKPLLQARSGGKIGMLGTLEIDGKKTLLEGSVQCGDVLLDFPSQKVTVTGVNGSLPFSVYISGASVAKPQRPLNFSKANYPALLAAMRREANNSGKNSILKIDTLQFGKIEAGDMRLRMKSGGGMVEFSSIASSLYSGTVLGKGFLFYDRGLRYGADLLVSDVSLRQFCNSYPALKGYISGLLDGVVSLYGGKGGLPDLTGFVDLWLHGGKDEEMLLSKEFLQKLAGKKMKGFFFREDRAYDRGEITASLEDGYLTFEQMDISHTNLIGMKDLSVSVAAVQNRIALEHLFEAIREAAARGKSGTGQPSQEAPVQTDIQWLE